MSKQIEPGSAEYWRLFDGFQHSAFRLECLQRYEVETEAEPLRHFLAAKPRPPMPSKERWVARIRAAVAAGKTMQRVHIAAEPLSDYLQYELAWSYASNVDAGEDIRILPTAEGTWPAELPRQDYWLFDSRDLLEFRYDSAGRLAAVVLEDGPQAVAQAASWRDTALRAAVPYRDYMSWHQGLLQRAS